MIAEKQLGSSLLKRKPRLKKFLGRLDNKAGGQISKEQAEAEKERIAAIVELCFEYEREKNSAERKNILRTLEEIAANEPVEIPQGSLDDFESHLIQTDSRYAQQSREADEESRRFLKKYFSLKTKAGLSTQEDVAKKTKLARSYIAVIESGEHKPQHKTLQKLAKAFKVDVSEFV